MNNVERLAKLINGREYGPRVLTKEEATEAKGKGIVVAFGYSDDLVEFEGAIHDEAGCYEGGTIHLSKDGLFHSECECECKWAKAAREKFQTIKAVWDDFGSPSWTFETDIPHETFELIDDGEVFCRGIVFDIKDLGEFQ